MKSTHSTLPVMDKKETLPTPARVINSTYRIQFHAEFTFSDLLDQLDYLHELGISTIYASPIFQAIPGSTHGYDGTDHYHINPEIGTIDQLRELAGQMRQKGMSWIQDIVPNHMAFHADNTRLFDVLERGRYSPYQDFFDINWEHPDPDLKGKLMVPLLGKSLNEHLVSADAGLGFSEKGFTLSFGELELPFSVCAYATLLSFLENMEGMEEVRQHLRTFQKMAMKGLPLEEWLDWKQSWSFEIANNDSLRKKMQQAGENVNNSEMMLSRLIHAQCYLPACWKETDGRINYRRFFTVNTLICLRMEDPKVFEEYHRFIFSLYEEELFQGFRIDHVDGMADPGTYIRRFRELFGRDCLLLVEKILESHETLPDSWLLNGATGYEFLHILNQTLVDPDGVAALKKFYNKLVPEFSEYEEIKLRSKKKILGSYMQGEWNNLVNWATRLNPDLNAALFKNVIGLFLIHFPVYRLYPNNVPLNHDALSLLDQVFYQVENGIRNAGKEIEWLKKIWKESDAGIPDENRIFFLQRMMQLASPLTAKGVEDTSFYLYNAFIAKNEVGDDPAVNGLLPPEFHQRMAERLSTTPRALNTTATHDTKRGEDARIRLNTLSFFSKEWTELVAVWMEKNRAFVFMKDERRIPSVNDEYFFYQTLIAGMPADNVPASFRNRLLEYLRKAIREGKEESDWAEPDMDYENGMEQFMDAALDNADFMESFSPFLHKIDQYASVLSLSQTLVKLTAPGIPDTYQGCELPEFSFVDPDNRRPVNYGKRKEVLRSESPHPKFLLTQKVLHCRNYYPEVFSKGEYIPLSFPDDRLMGFARVFEGQWFITIVPMGNALTEPVTEGNWESLPVILPENAPGNWKHVLTDERFNSAEMITAARLFRHFPVALLQNT